MNLADIIRRADRSLTVAAGDVEPIVYSVHGKKFQAVRLSKVSRIRLHRADEFYVLRTFPRVIGWKLTLDGHGSGDVSLTVLFAADETVRKTLFETRLSAKTEPLDVELEWPMWAGDSAGYHLELAYQGECDLVILVGRAFNPRHQILGFLRGAGVEAGPGLNPHVLPSKDVSVRYVESVPAERWVALYKKQNKPSRVQTENLWDNYVLGSALDLSVVDDQSLDFVFSNHVFEHFVNPLGVLENWRKKLKGGGVVAGVVPDCRFTFDLRQVPSTIEEVNSERAAKTYNIDYEKYVRWCRFTAPYNTPENLIERQYSIHVHYYTPERFAEIIQILIKDGIFGSLYLDTSPNNKDFGFLLSAS